MKLSRLVKLALIPTALISCSDLKSPELIPCMCDGTEKTLGLFECMCEPGKSKPVKKVKKQAYIQNEPQVDPTQDQINAYVYLHQSRDQYAPVKLEYVDFRIPKATQYEQYTNKLGNYRFRIFGCRRFDKEVFLNQGRAMQKDMKFFDIFYETMNDYYPVVVEKNNPYYMYSDKAQAEYVLTAEINDYFMNVCDEFDWNDVKKKDLRTGTSEMTVTWRLMDLTKSHVYCKGTTTGYGEMKDGEYKGEVLLVERAFADALSKLPQIECYNTELSKRVKPEVLQAQLAQLKEQEQSRITFKNQYAEELHGINALQSCGSKDLKPQDLLPVEVANTQTYTTYNASSDGFAEEDGDVFASGKNVDGYINDDGNFVVLSSDIKDKTSLIPENKMLNGYITEDEQITISSGSYEGSRQPLEIAGIIESNGNFVTKAMIEERSGGSSKFSNGKTGGIQELRINDNCSEVTLGQDSCTTISVTKNNITYTDDYWIDVPVDESAGFIERQNRAAAENMYAEGKSNFCIQSVKPYESLSPQNMYRLRASVVSVANPSGRKGAGLIISDQLILTSADLVDKNKNKFYIKTINGVDYTGSAFRVNPNKNVALILLDEKTKFNPLPLRLDLPEVGKEMFMTLGLLDFDQGENYLETEGEVIGYRYSEDKGAEIIVNTYVQNQTLGSSLIDKNGNITGLSHSGVRTDEGGDLFIPIETALKSVGLNICGVKFTNKIPASVSVAKPVSTAIDNSKGDKAPKAMSVKERK